MIMMDVNPKLMRRKVRRMLGKSHIGLQQDKDIQKLLGKGHHNHLMIIISRLVVNIPLLNLFKF